MKRDAQFVDMPCIVTPFLNAARCTEGRRGGLKSLALKGGKIYGD